MIPQFLYQLTARDQQLDPLARVHFFRNRTQASLTVIQSFIVPVDRNFVLETVYFGWIGGGGAYDAVGWNLFIEDGAEPIGSGRFVFKATEVLGGTSGSRGIVFPQPLFIPARRRIYTRMQFQSAASDNAYDFGMAGVMIPRGNISFSQPIIET